MKISKGGKEEGCLLSSIRNRRMGRVKRTEDEERMGLAEGGEIYHQEHSSEVRGKNGRERALGEIKR